MEDDSGEGVKYRKEGESLELEYKNCKVNLVFLYNEIKIIIVVLGFDEMKYIIQLQRGKVRRIEKKYLIVFKGM